jgi:two-component system, OmpR family, response regulator
MQGHKLSVLLVEDSRLVAERLREAILTLPEAQLVAVVESESQAVATLKQRQVDVVVLDLHLRDGTGFGVLRAISRNEVGKTLVIVLTNHDLGEYRRAAAALGAQYFLDKMRDIERLPALLARLASNTEKAHETPTDAELAIKPLQVRGP